MHFHIDSFYCKKNSMAKLQPTSIHGQKYWIFLSNQNRNRKFVVLCSLFSVVEIVSFYILVLNKIDISESDPKYLLTKECKKQEMSSHIIWPYAGFAVVWLGVRWEVWEERSGGRSYYILSDLKPKLALLIPQLWLLQFSLEGSNDKLLHRKIPLIERKQKLPPYFSWV